MTLHRRIALKRFSLVGAIISAVLFFGGAQAADAHWVYTYSQMWDSLQRTNLDRVCGWGAVQFCNTDTPRKAKFLSWVGSHSLNSEFVWTNLQYCGFNCDNYDFCDARVHVTDHNEGGRVNVNYLAEWYHKESSCNVNDPIQVVP